MFIVTNRILLKNNEWIRAEFPVDDMVIAMQQLRQMPYNTSAVSAARVITKMSASSPVMTKLIADSADALLKDIESSELATV
jgi:hypothetical protein